MDRKNDIIYDFEPLWGAWKIEEFVGAGNFGRVYKVSREEWGQKYISAVKLISIPQGSNDYKEAQTIGIGMGSMAGYFEGFVKSIVSEIELMYKLKGNSNIVSYEDHKIIEKEGEVGWHILIKMEFVQSLADYAADHVFTTSDVIRLGVDICKALETCEKYNIIHRDIKDDNIFISKDGNFKLGDFGIARELSKSGRAASMRGTPLYMAPEVYKGEDYDASVDTYSLGMVLYKLLNKGRLPFMPPYPDNITYNDTENSIENRMRGGVPNLPVDAQDKLGEMVLKAISCKPSDRFGSPGDFRKVLERLSGQEIVNEEAVVQEGLAAKVLDGNAVKSIGGKHGRTVSIFDQDPQNHAGDHVETAALFKDVKKKKIQKGDREERETVVEESLSAEENELMEEMKKEIKKDLEMMGKSISKSGSKKKSPKILSLLPYLIIVLIVISGGMMLMLSLGNKGPMVPAQNHAAKSQGIDQGTDELQYLEEAQRKFDLGNYDEALELVMLALKQNPNNAGAISLQIQTKGKQSDVLVQKGMALLKENKLKEAQQSFEAAVNAFRSNKEAQKQLDYVNNLINGEK